MAKWIYNFFSLGRGLSDSVAVAVCASCLAFSSLPKIFPLWAYIASGFLGFYFLAQLIIRLRSSKIRQLAANRRLQKSTQWAQTFITQHLSDIRRPLQGLIGVRDVYDFNFKNKDTEEYMEIVNHCSEHVVRLINRTQLYSELRSGEYFNKDVRFTLNDLLKDSLKIAETGNPGKKVKVDQHLSPKVMRDYFGSFDLIRALLVEIIDNSIRFSTRADIEITADAIKSENHNLVLRIRDRGPGISKAQQQELQDKLDRNSMSFDIKNGADGIGIPLIRSLSQILSAKIDVHTETGSGTEFTIQLQVPIYTNILSEPRDKNTSQHSNQILVAEDDPLAQKIVAAMLGRLGYRCTIVSNGHDAVELCRMQRFGFILMDLEMPVMDGWEATAHIMKNYSVGNFEPPAIVALTARNSPADRARAENAGCQHFLAKPINKDQLDTHLKNAGITPHFLPNSHYQEDKFDGLELLAGKTLDFKKFYSHYDNDMALCQMIIAQAIDTVPALLEELDACVLSQDPKQIKHCLHQLTGEFRALLCNSAVHILERLNGHADFDNLEFISDIEQLNRYCDSLLKELSVLSKHNEMGA